MNGRYLFQMGVRLKITIIVLINTAPENISEQLRPFEYFKLIDL